MNCQAIEVRNWHKKRCSSRVVRIGLCTFHYVLATRVIKRHDMPSEAISSIMEGK